MVIWEADYGPEGDFYATKKEAQRAVSASDGLANLARHDIKPGREGLAEFLNYHYGACYGKRKDYS